MVELECGCDLVLSALPSRATSNWKIKEYYCPNHYMYVRRKDQTREALEGKELKS